MDRPTTLLDQEDSFWRDVDRLLHRKASRRNRNRPVDSLLRIREWNGKGFVDRTDGRKDGKSERQCLEAIANERGVKARIEAGKGWTGKVTWIHIPLNDMKLCEDVLNTVCKETKGQVRGLRREGRWWDQLHEPWWNAWSETETTEDAEPTKANEERDDGWKHEPAAAPFMDAASFEIDFEVRDGEWRPCKDKGSPTESMTYEHMPNNTGNHSVPKAKNKQNDTVNLVKNLVLYVPYLHWETLPDHERFLQARYQKGLPFGVHPRRSLDEAAHQHQTYSSLTEKNGNQVVTRFLREKNSKRKVRHGLSLMVVDQLWLWVLDEDTLITCFPGQYCSPDWFLYKSCRDLHLDCLAREQVRSMGDGKDLDARCMASHIISRCYQIFTHRSLRDPDLRYIDIFERSIVNQRTNCTDLFRALEIKKNTPTLFEKRSKGASKANSAEHAISTPQPRRTRNVYNLEEDIDAVGKIRDINEKLHVIIHIVDLQLGALESTGLSDWPIWRKDLEKSKQRLNGLSDQAKDINEMLFQTLELKQAQLSVRQNQVVITFTIVTIIFLPLGFISSIFGMNATEFNNGSPVGLGRIFTYMFSISAALSSVALGLAFGSDIADILGSLTMPRWNRRQHSEEARTEKRRLWPFSRERIASTDREDPRGDP